MNKEKLQLIWQYIVLKHLRKPKLLGMDLEIKAGPFKGMRYITEANCSRLMPKIIGCYESAMTSWILDIPSRQYDVILDVGCAEGYYAVGFAYQNYAKRIYAFDIEEEALDNARRLAALNHVENKICFESLCDEAKISTLCANKTALIFCDIEGSEDALLDPDKIPMLRNIDMIIESHDFIVPGMINKLFERFQGTHHIEIVGDAGVNPDKFPVLKSFNKRIRRKFVNEGRSPGMMWIRLTVK
jgi:SAM-dependent methyltransferase